ncbi:hypothetical protein [Streptomyces antibioticus]|uniref:hypothetical protein n=1 Tax=Streptomyces antibioticus TaxID=1890 RepID=UPI003F452BC0
MTATTASPAGAAFDALADHSLGCPTCRPDPDRPGLAPPECPQALELYRAWRRAWRSERSAAA